MSGGAGPPQRCWTCRWRPSPLAFPRGPGAPVGRRRGHTPPGINRYTLYARSPILFLIAPWTTPLPPSPSFFPRSTRKRPSASASERSGRSLPTSASTARSSSPTHQTTGRRRSPETLGATVVRPEKRGYGNAYLAGLACARGRYVVIGDADNTYDFLEIPNLLGPLDAGADMVLGSRLRGEIRPGAMPALHRYVGEPLPHLTPQPDLFHPDIRCAHGVPGVPEGGARAAEPQDRGNGVCKRGSHRGGEGRAPD